MTKWLEGKKTYFAAAFAIVAGLGGAYLGAITNDTAIELVAGGLALLGIRSATAKIVVGRVVEQARDAGAAQRIPPGVKTLPPVPGSGGVRN